MRDLRLRFLADRAKRTFRFLSPYYPVVREWTRKHAERWKRRYRALFPPDTATPEQAAARPGSPWRETVVLALDVVAFNVALYYFVRALLFAAAGIASGWTALAWAFGYAALVIALGWMPIAGRRQSPLQIKAFLNLGWAFAVILAMVSRVTVPSAMYQADFSWLVPEVIKTPLWAGMMASLSPIFVSAFVLAVLGLMRWTAGGGRRWLPAAAAGGAGLAATAVFRWTFSGMDLRYEFFYWFVFASPLLLACIAGLAGWFRLVYRAMPLALHVLLIGLSYVGLLPFHSWIDLRQGPDSAERALARVPGARLAYRPTAEELRSDFRFPRRLLRMGDSLVLAAGPMGNTTLLTIDRRTGQRLQTAKYPGLIRDIAPSPDGSAIWSTNWDYAKLAVVEPATLRARCRLDLSEHKMHSVWSVRPVGNRVYVTSQTYPVFAEFAVPPDNDPCGATLSRIIDFHDTGFTPLTDGAYGLDVDPARGAALVTVGMLEGRYKLALVEIGLDDFRIRRELRFPAGTTIIPIAGTRRVLVPSYYYGEIFEVDLEAWRLVRSIRSAANIFHLAYDPARRLIYGVSRAAGVLQVIDYDTGKLVRQDFIGNKADPLLLDGDRLLFASRFGIVEMDLSKYVGPPAARSNPGEPSKTVAPPSGQQTMDAGS